MEYVFINFISRFFFALFLFVLLRFLENPEYFIPYLSTAFRTAWMFAEDHYLLHRSPEFTYFLAMLGQNMLFHGFFLTFFQSITKNRVLSPILTALFCSAFFYLSSHSIYNILYIFSIRFYMQVSEHWRQKNAPFYRSQSQIIYPNSFSILCK